MRFRLYVKTSVKVLSALILVALTVTIVLTVFRLANVLGFFSVSIGVDIASLAVSVFLLAVCVVALTTTGYTLNEKGVTFRLLFVKIHTPLERIVAFEYSVKLKLACVYHSVDRDAATTVEDGDEAAVGQMIINISPDKLAGFATELKRLKPMVAILPVDDMQNE